MYGVGIDLGTSFTAAAVTSTGTVDMVPLGGQAVLAPSAACLNENAVLLIGEEADRLGLLDPGRAAWEFKRRLGDPTPVILGGTPHSPTALMAALLRSVLDTVSRLRGGPPDRVVLTHPAVWGPYRREQFAAIPNLAALPRPAGAHPSAGDVAPDQPEVITTTEPVAAATYYCATRPLPTDGLLAVYDLGGGTFDSAIVRNGRDGLEIVGVPEGIEWLGGADFDQAIVDHVDHRLDGAVTALDPGDPATARTLAALRRECMLAKEALSTRERADIPVRLPGAVRDVSLTREEFERKIAPSLEATIEAFRRTLVAADVTPQDLAAVLLVGGSSQIPLVTRLLRDALRRPVVINTHPKHAVALGAAMLSAGPAAGEGPPATRRSARSASRSGSVSVSTPGPAMADTMAGPVQAATVPVAAVLPADAPDGAANPPEQQDRPTDPAPIAPPPARRRPRSRRALLSVSVLGVVAGIVVPLGLFWLATRPGNPGTVPVGTDPGTPSATALVPVTPTPTTPTPTTPTPTTPTPTATSPATSSPIPSRTTTRAATPATPASVPAGGTGTIRSVATGQCVDSDSDPAVTLNGTPLGGHAFGAACDGSNTQQWREGPPLSRDSVQGGDWYRLLDQETGFCLDSNADGLVYTLPCLDPDNFQLWQRETPSGTTVAYRNRSTGRCLSLSPSDATLRTLPCSANDTRPRTMLFQRKV